ncbi:Aste57867_17366 [Aphanomyces stellatus]|uniref:Aste57867_17366 protein n=1 Tax=Aphanomyces stellatus TaxID=120398 RepID=A0A485L8V7_9STRA|nr:hypothetical protein As57867_017306 [Aphanomyces stellatus]VFT94122.1 Aste57867_17366 [Aphanomyces stellatus]
MLRLAALFVAVFASGIEATKPGNSGQCTAILIGAKASAHGTPMTTHSNDCPYCDFRLVKVPPKTHVAGSMRDVYLMTTQYPRHVGTRSPVYDSALVDRRFFNWTATQSIAQIPQVNATFGYIEGVYPILNDHQVALGESTCGAKFVSKPIGHGGNATFDIMELARVALERTTSARDAIDLMGHLGETYGYYGMAWDQGAAAFDNSGEALTVTDPLEAWMFHILPDDTGNSAVWVAQRVPETHITAIANRFTIRRINLTDTDNFKGSTNLFDVAKRNGFWNELSPFDFTDAYAAPPAPALSHSLRVGRIMSLANTSIDINAFQDISGKRNPFSVAVTTPVAISDVMRYQRDHYEGTKFDLTKGRAGGPHGNPDRYGKCESQVDGKVSSGGHFERAISRYDATYTYVTALHPTNPLLTHLWFGPYAPHATIYQPIFVHTERVPPVLSTGSLRNFRLSDAFWAHAIIGNYAARWYAFAHPVVAAVQANMESRFLVDLPSVNAHADDLQRTQGNTAAIQYLTDTSERCANDTHAAAVALFHSLVTRFHDGTVLGNLTELELSATPMSMSRWWLKMVGYYDDHVKPEATVTTEAAHGHNFSDNQVFVIAMCFILVGYYQGRNERLFARRGYSPVQ